MYSDVHKRRINFTRRNALQSRALESAVEKKGNHFKKRSSEKERREDALAPRADEGRDKLRKAAGRRK